MLTPSVKRISGMLYGRADRADCVGIPLSRLSFELNADNQRQAAVPLTLCRSAMSWRKYSSLVLKATSSTAQFATAEGVADQSASQTLAQEVPNVPAANEPSENHSGQAASKISVGQSVFHDANKYHSIDTSFPGIEVLNAEPPVYLVHNFLSRESCAALIDAAKEGILPSVQYDNSAVVNQSAAKWLAIPGLMLLVARTLLHPEADMATTVLSIARTAAFYAIFVAAAWQLVPALVLKIRLGGKVFTGTKWSTEAHTLPEDVFQSHSYSGTCVSIQQFTNNGSHISGRHGTDDLGSVSSINLKHERGRAHCRSTPSVELATGEYVSKLEAILGAHREQLEVPQVSRYLKGEYQGKHQDARFSSDPDADRVLSEDTGQRLVQCLCYLNTVQPSGGGCTKFFHPSLGGLEVSPQQGALLLFFPAFLNEEVDDRMLHSGEVVREGEKWVVNTWLGPRRGHTWGGEQTTSL